MELSLILYLFHSMNVLLQWFLSTYHKSSILLHVQYLPAKQKLPNLWFTPLDYCTTYLTTLPVSLFSAPSSTIHSPECSLWNTNFLSDYIQLLLKSSNNFSHLLIIKHELLTLKTWFVVHLLFYITSYNSISALLFSHYSHRHLLLFLKHKHLVCALSLCNI